jgi:hypothetical protein
MVHTSLDMSSFEEFGSLGSYKIAVSTKYITTRTTAHFNGISNPSNQSILFLSNSWQLLLHPVYITFLDPEVKTPGKIKWRKSNLYFSHAVKEECPARPVRPSCQSKSPVFWYFS